LVISNRVTKYVRPRMMRKEATSIGSSEGGVKMTNSYVYSKFVIEALEWILLAPTGDSSRQNRVYKIFKCAFGCGLRDVDFPQHVRSDWRKIAGEWDKKVPKKEYEQIYNPTKATAYSLTPTEAKRVLESFLKIAVAVIKQQGSDQSARSRNGGNRR